MPTSSAKGTAKDPPNPSLCFEPLTPTQVRPRACSLKLGYFGFCGFHLWARLLLKWKS